MSGITTQSITKKFKFTFDTTTGKKKSMSFNYSEIYDQTLAQKLINIAQSMVQNTGALNITLTGINGIEHSVTTTNTFSEAN